MTRDSNRRIPIYSRNAQKWGVFPKAHKKKIIITIKKSQKSNNKYNKSKKVPLSWKESICPSLLYWGPIPIGPGKPSHQQKSIWACLKSSYLDLKEEPKWVFICDTMRNYAIDSVYMVIRLTNSWVLYCMSYSLWRMVWGLLKRS